MSCEILCKLRTVVEEAQSLPHRDTFAALQTVGAQIHLTKVHLRVMVPTTQSGMPPDIARPWIFNHHQAIVGSLEDNDLLH
jgi:hypothetical protein